MGRTGYPAKFRRRVVDLIGAGRTVREVAKDLGSEWAADGAIHELDRLEGWLNLQSKGALGFELPRGAAEARRALADLGQEHYRHATIEAER
jgi:hypothetical protein